MTVTIQIKERHQIWPQLQFYERHQNSPQIQLYERHQNAPVRLKPAAIHFSFSYLQN